MRRPFFDTLRDVRGGQVIDDLAEQMQELVRAVEATGKAGTLTLTLEVKPFKGAAEAAVVVKDTIKLKLPKHESAGTVLFATVDGNLQRNHPAQDELPGITLAAASH
ncbi:hypothetical protein [Caldimonas sp.]|uniref:hypothetical protein n=1 Tax=Caldimonas sp. TaxID=2838790 RepID=UPI00307ECB49